MSWIERCMTSFSWQRRFWIRTEWYRALVSAESAKVFAALIVILACDTDMCAHEQFHVAFFSRCRVYPDRMSQVGSYMNCAASCFWEELIGWL